MGPLTLQEVVERINKAALPPKEPRAREDRQDQSHRPEFYLPRLTWRLANFFFNARAGASLS
jgi:hypothetical protein